MAKISKVPNNTVGSPTKTKRNASSPPSSNDSKKKKLNVYKMKIKVGQGIQRKAEYMDEVLAETLGPMGMIVALWVVQYATGYGGFMGKMLELCKGKFIHGMECSFIDEFDCRIYVPLFERVSHTTNNKKGVGYVSKGREYHRVVFVGSPDRLDPDEDDVAREKRFRDACVKQLEELNEKDKSGRVTKYVPWDPKRHSKTPKEGGYRALDKLMTDESVGDVIRAYMVPAHIVDHEVYSYLKQNGIGNLYSRNEDTKRYSYYAQKQFGFPDSAGEQTDYEDNDDDDNGE